MHLEEGPKLADLVLGDAGRRERRGQRLQDPPGADEVIDGRAHMVEIDGDGRADGGGVRFADDQATGGPPPHPRDAMVLDQPDRLPQDRPADAVTLHELGFRAEDLVDRPAYRR